MSADDDFDPVWDFAFRLSQRVDAEIHFYDEAQAFAALHGAVELLVADGLLTLPGGET